MICVQTSKYFGNVTKVNDQSYLKFQFVLSDYSEVKFEGELSTLTISFA